MSILSIGKEKQLFNMPFLFPWLKETMKLIRCLALPHFANALKYKSVG